MKTGVGNWYKRQTEQRKPKGGKKNYKSGRRWWRPLSRLMENLGSFSPAASLAFRSKKELRRAILEMGFVFFTVSDVPGSDVVMMLLTGCMGWDF